MDDAFVVRGFQRVSDLSRDGDRFSHLQRTTRNHFRKGRSVNQFKDESISVT